MASLPHLPSFHEVEQLLVSLMPLEKAREILRPALLEAEAAERDLDAHPEIHVSDFWSGSFPEALRRIPAPPWALYSRGDTAFSFAAHANHLGVVGTRRPSGYGVEAVHRLLGGLKTFPLNVVSGLALGIDSVAHTAAHRARFVNTAVLGNGLASIYPAQNERLAREIVDQGGCVLSEHPPRTPAYPANFPRRNRIVSGLSDVLLVVQGTKKSGTIHTARHALEQGRSVCVVPGDIFSELSFVPNHLLRDGAHPITCAEDLDMLLAQSWTHRNSYCQK